MLEAKVIIAMTVSKFEFEKIGLGAIKLDPVSGAKIMSDRVVTGWRYETDGELVSKLQITAKPM